MEKVIKKVLNTIEKNGFEAYIVGGYVRDLLLGKLSWDIDICTNALPKDLVMLFPNSNVGIYGAVDFKIGKYSFEITTYRKEFKYTNRHPEKIQYVRSLSEDLKRRDFTINTLCMNQNGNIIDLLDSKKDIISKTLVSVGDSNTKFKDDPLRMLRAVRFATVLGFNLSKDVINAIKSNKNEITNLSDYRIIEELTKILISSNYSKGLELLNSLGLLGELGISYDNIVYVNDINGMFAQLDMKKTLAFNKETVHNINTIKEIIDYGKIDNKVLYNYGLYFSQIAGQILNIDKNYIYNLYKKMPIKSKKEIAVSTSKIIDYLNLEDGETIKAILSDVEDKIINKELKNNTKAILSYLKQYKGD